MNLTFPAQLEKTRILRSPLFTKDVFFGVLCAIFAVVTIERLLYEHKRDKHLPPGPRRLPVVGNLIPELKERPWLIYDELAKHYGGLFSLQHFTQTVLVITDIDDAHRLLNRRQDIYSDRPRMTQAFENASNSQNLVLMPYGEEYKKHKRMQAPVLRPDTSRHHGAWQNLESKRLVHALLSSNDFVKHLRLSSANIAYMAAYNFRITDKNHDILKRAYQVQDNFVCAVRPATWLVDVAPWLNRVPFLVAPWKWTAQEHYCLESKLHLDNWKRGLESEGWNWAKEINASEHGQDMTEEQKSYNAGVLNLASLDTTAIAARSAILAMLKYPEAARGVQRELDAVVGSDRLPEVEDEHNLPAVEAFVKEVLRWRPVLPMVVPHATSEADTYIRHDGTEKRYEIPKGVTVIPSVWSMNHDARVYEDSHQFQPKRWMGPHTLREVSFGFGHRKCPGRNISRKTLRVFVACILWAFDVRPAKDKDGNQMEVDDTAYSSGFASQPPEFDVEFVPRNDHVREIIVKEWKAVELAESL